MSRVRGRSPNLRFRAQPDVFLEAGLYTWDSQAKQYPATGEPGIHYFKGDLDDNELKPPEAELTRWVDCLLSFDPEGRLVGILNRYPMDFPPLERRGNVNVWVHPEHQRQGIGAELVRAALDRWVIDFTQQRYTTSGANLANKILDGRA